MHRPFRGQITTRCRIQRCKVHAELPEAFEVAVMGCAVNGPGEAGDADFGIAGGREGGDPVERQRNDLKSGDGHEASQQCGRQAAGRRRALAPEPLPAEPDGAPEPGSPARSM